MKLKFKLIFAAAATLFAATLAAQEHQHEMPMPMPPAQEPQHETPQPPPPAEHQHEMQPMPQHEHHMDHMMPARPGEPLLHSQASGTSVNPSSLPMEMFSMTHHGEWMVMTHGVVFLNDVQQTGPRGRDKAFSTNWGMLMASRPLGGGSLMLRTMLSLEPATVTHKQYPELFQTGETAYGRPLVDAQHPHDFFMELAAEYARPLNEKMTLYLYAAPVGDPALGPVAYPHRASAMEIPQATLSHHVQDSTHLANEVITAGLSLGAFRFESSGFHGGEPDEGRWDIDTGAIDSWSARVWWLPSPNWAAQISTGHLEKPEALEAGNIQRTTASVSWGHPTADGMIATSLIWGQNEKKNGEADHTTQSYLAEGVWKFGANYASARAESVDKDELFPGVSHEIYRINALTVGYSRDVLRVGSGAIGIGANTTLYRYPSALKAFYGSDPRSYLFYVRLRPAQSMMSM